MHDFCDYARLEMQSFYMYFIYIYICMYLNGDFSYCCVANLLKGGGMAWRRFP